MARGPVICTDEEDMCEPNSQLLLVKLIEVSAGADIASLLSKAPCHCGHRHGHTTVNAAANDYVVVTRYTTRNF